jgi:hypothetical protein
MVLALSLYDINLADTNVCESAPAFKERGMGINVLRQAVRNAGAAPARAGVCRLPSASNPAQVPVPERLVSQGPEALEWSSPALLSNANPCLRAGCPISAGPAWATQTGYEGDGKERRCQARPHPPR